jgi:hypothetical protein
MGNRIRQNQAADLAKRSHGDWAAWRPAARQADQQAGCMHLGGAKPKWPNRSDRTKPSDSAHGSNYLLARRAANPSSWGPPFFTKRTPLFFKSRINGLDTGAASAPTGPSQRTAGWRNKATARRDPVGDQAQEVLRGQPRVSLALNAGLRVEPVSSRPAEGGTRWLNTSYDPATPGARPLTSAAPADPSGTPPHRPSRIAPADA